MDSTLAPSSSPVVTSRALFFRFLETGLSGFGGVLPFAHRMIVERQRWLDEAEFAEVLAISQFLPGPNIVNVSIIVGRRFQGVRGACAAFLGLMLMPMVIVMTLALVYAQFAQVDVVRHAFNGVAAAASGLVLSMGIKLGRRVRNHPVMLSIAAITFIAIGVLRFPLVWVLASMAPVSILFVWSRRAR